MPSTNFPNGVNVGSSDGGTALLELGGTAVNVTAAELNRNAGAAGAVLAYTASGKKAAGGTVSVGVGANAGTVSTGLTTVEFAVASLYGANEPGAGLANVRVSNPGGGTIL